MAAAVSVERSSFLVVAASWPYPEGRVSPLAKGQARLARRVGELFHGMGARKLDPGSSCAPVARGLNRTITESRSNGYHTATGGGSFLFKIIRIMMHKPNKSTRRLNLHYQKLQKSYRVRTKGK